MVSSETNSCELREDAVVHSSLKCTSIEGWIASQVSRGCRSWKIKKAQCELQMSSQNHLSSDLPCPSHALVRGLLTFRARTNQSVKQSSPTQMRLRMQVTKYLSCLEMITCKPGLLLSGKGMAQTQDFVDDSQDSRTSACSV